MKHVLLITSVAVMGLSGCATVDLQSMAGAAEAGSSAVAPEKNIVERAVANLKAAFASRGFGAKSSERKMQAAADMLLDGLAARRTSSQDDGYDGAVRPVAVVLSDAEFARTHVDQTRRAAEIYFEVADADRDMKEELRSLQAALVASEQAVRGFSDSLPAGRDSDLAELRASIEGLRDVTDRFGDRVRAHNMTRDEQLTG